MIGWEVSGPAKVLSENASAGTATLICNSKPGPGATVTIRAKYTLRNTTCYSPPVVLDAITPASIVQVGSPTTTYRRNANLEICGYQTVFHLQVLDQNGKNWQSTCHGSITVSEEHTDCCGNFLGAIMSGGGPAQDGAFDDILSLDTGSDTPLASGILVEKKQTWWSGDCYLTPTPICLTWRSALGERVPGQCPGPCTQGDYPCNP